MNSLITELGKKLAEQWMSLLVLPGALFLAVAVAARALGHTHALSPDHLEDQITTWAGTAYVATISGQIILLAAVLAGSAAVGLIAQMLGSLFEKSVLAADWWTWPTPLRAMADRLTAHRQRRWNMATATWHRHREEAARALTRGKRLDPAKRRMARASMLRIAAEYPDRPTWCGDRVHAVAVRMDRDHHMDLAVVIPHLWLVLPEEIRAEIATARQGIVRATTLTAWSIPYATLTAWWWPAVLIAAGISVTGWWRTRTAVDLYATLLEATTRIHTRNLVDSLGLEPPTSLTPDIGDALTRSLTPGLPSPSTFTESED